MRKYIQKRQKPLKAQRPKIPIKWHKKRNLEVPVLKCREGASATLPPQGDAYVNWAEIQGGQKQSVFGQAWMVILMELR